MKKVLVQNGIVLGILVWDGITPWSPNEGVRVIDVEDNIEVHADWLYDGSTFTNPNPEPVIPVVEQVGPNVVA
jgi:hypothetical protein